MKISRVQRRIGLWLVLTLFALVSLASGCGRAARLRALRRDSTVVAFGDSITAGAGATAQEAYPAVLAKQLNCTVINAGVPGEESGQALARLPKLLREHRAE